MEDHTYQCLLCESWNKDNESFYICADVVKATLPIVCRSCFEKICHFLGVDIEDSEVLYLSVREYEMLREVAKEIEQRVGYILEPKYLLKLLK